MNARSRIATGIAAVAITVSALGVFAAPNAEATHTNKWWPCNVMPQLSYICHQ